jgi:8-oxo-dGTP pyrophosphatase MutT (NUDIX family)
VSLEEDLRVEGEPDREFVPGIAARLPRKLVAAGALVRDRQDRALFVEPVYKRYLDIPGGVAEAGEPPLAACRRELREELGITVQIGRLLVVDWVPAQGVWGDGLMFVFDGGVLDDDQVRLIQLPADELRAFTFLSLDAAKPRLRPSMARRVSCAYDTLTSGAEPYAELGRAPWPPEGCFPARRGST